MHPNEKKPVVYGKIALFTKGVNPSILDTDRANEIIRKTNAVRYGVWLIKPDGSGNAVVAENGVIIDMYQLVERINKLSDLLNMPKITKTFSVECGGSATISLIS